ncbi:MAG: hypothetical protein NZ869_09485 [Thermoanaerobaculum sp.]|nr:hypothetical protein [Thermoanaerobaculum sp.]MDW7968625.1 hypothetical protein [Thermoanaerobaculum sp.]
MSSRALVVLGDGAQAAFCSGVVAGLAEQGVVWQEGAAAGLAAQVALLALAGEALEGARRFLRMAEEGAALFSAAGAPASAEARKVGWLALPDVYRVPGWLDPSVLEEYLAPDWALVRRVNLWVAWENLVSGERGWIPLRQGEQLLVTAAFPWGWPAREGIWGGVGACAELEPPPLGSEAVDLVCGFPVPAVERPGQGAALIGANPRREELVAARTAVRWASHWPQVRVFAPQQRAYLDWSQRDSALLGVEYPLPLEQNGELMAQLVRFGEFVASRGGERL